MPGNARGRVAAACRWRSASKRPCTPQCPRVPQRLCAHHTAYVHHSSRVQHSASVCHNACGHHSA
eukprot:2405004-Pyramimonas_sp.AAC.1